MLVLGLWLVAMSDTIDQPNIVAINNSDPGPKNPETKP